MGEQKKTNSFFTQFFFDYYKIILISLKEQEIIDERLSSLARKMTKKMILKLKNKRLKWLIAINFNTIEKRVTTFYRKFFCALLNFRLMGEPGIGCILRQTDHSTEFRGHRIKLKCKLKILSCELFVSINRNRDGLEFSVTQLVHNPHQDKMDENKNLKILLN